MAVAYHKMYMPSGTNARLLPRVDSVHSIQIGRYEPNLRVLRNIPRAIGVFAGMHKYRLVKSGLLILILAAVVSAADITGNWKADLETPQGKVQVNYTFKQEGETLTGTWQTARSPTVQISEGKVTGDKVSFLVKVDPNGGMTFAHEGTIAGDEIQLTMKPSGEFPGATVVAKKVK